MHSQNIAILNLHFIDTTMPFLHYIYLTLWPFALALDLNTQFTSPSISITQNLVNIIDLFRMTWF